MKNSIFLNILSLFGYLNCAFWWYELFVILPDVILQGKLEGTDPIPYYAHLEFLIMILKFWGIICVLLLVLTILEYFIKKYLIIVNINLKFPNIFKQIHTIFFWLGCFLIFSPVILIMLRFI